MSVELSPDDVADMTGTDVSPSDITVAADVIETQTGYTPDAHNTDRGISAGSVRMAWAVVASRIHEQASSSGAVTGETQGDYSYSEDSALAVHDRFANVVDGFPQQLLNLPRAHWAHI